MSLGDHLRELRRRLLISALALLAGAVLGWYLYDEVYAPPDPAAAGHRAAARRREDHRAQLRGADRGVLPAGEHRHLRRRHRLEPGLAVPAVGVHRPRADPQGATGLPRVHRGDRPAVPRRVLVRLRDAAEGRADPHQLHAAGRGELPRGGAVLQLRHALHPGVRPGLPDARLLVALNVAHVLPAATMRRTWRPALLIIFVFAAVATPTPDPFTMFLLAIPLAILYFGRSAWPRSSTGAAPRTSPSGLTCPTTSASAL